MPAATPPGHTRIRILLVDDHPMVREGLRARLGSVPHFEVVGEAADHASALGLLSRLAPPTRLHDDALSTDCDPDTPSVVLLDVGLKNSSGIDLASAMLARCPRLRVLMFSMYDNPEYVQRALQAGASGYVLKDAPAGEVVAAIEAVASGGTFLSPALSKRLFQDQRAKPLLSPRESEILSSLARGESSKQIARHFDLSVRTVEAHRHNIRRKLDLAGQAELIKYAVEHARGMGLQ